MKLPKYFFKRLFIIILVLTVFSFWLSETDDYINDGYYEETTCNISNIKLHGEIMSYIPYDAMAENGIALIDAVSSEDIVNEIEEAENDEDIKAILLEIDSRGGTPVASEEIANSLKRATKPTIAWIREAGLSAAYWSATGADIMFASQNSDVGSVGVTMSYIDNEKENKENGLTYNQLSSGKFKDAGDYDKILTTEEKELFMRDINIIHENFVKAISDNRNLDIEKVRILADGSSMLGQMALENGLIDKIGGKYEVEEYLKGIIRDDVVLCK